MFICSFSNRKNSRGNLAARSVKQKLSGYFGRVCCGWPNCLRRPSLVIATKIYTGINQRRSLAAHSTRLVHRNAHKPGESETDIHPRTYTNTLDRTHINADARSRSHINIGITHSGRIRVWRWGMRQMCRESWRLSLPTIFDARPNTPNVNNPFFTRLREPSDHLNHFNARVVHGVGKLWSVRANPFNF